MIQTTITIEVEVFYDVDDAETVSVDITAFGKINKIDDNGILERYEVDLLWDSIKWRKDEYSSTVNKAIHNYLENNKKDIYSMIMTKFTEKYVKK